MDPNSSPVFRRRVAKLLNLLAKAADQDKYSYLLLAYPKPAKQGETLKAEVAFKIDNPADMAALLDALATQHPQMTQAIAVIIQMWAQRAVKAQAKPQGKIIGLDSKIIPQ